MTIRVDELRIEPSPMAHGKGDRDRAERRGRESDEVESSHSESDGSSVEAGIASESLANDALETAKDTAAPEAEVKEREA